LIQRLVVAIDGPSGAGKSTAGRSLAERLDYLFIDTGAMYRALGLKALRRRIPLDDAEALAELARVTRIELTERGRGVTLDGEDVTALVRTQEVGDAASRLSVHGGVRREMVARQRELGQGGGVVLDGRDIGTAVFPRADVKFYLDADPARRARRRASELAAAGQVPDVALVERQIEVAGAIFRFRCRQEPAHRTFPAGFEAAIGMQEQEPAARSRGRTCGELAAAPAGCGNDLGTCRAGQSDGFVCRAAIRDDHLADDRRAMQRRQRLRKRRGRIQCRNDDRQ